MNNIVICECMIPSSKFSSFTVKDATTYTTKTIPLKARRYYNGEELNVADPSYNILRIAPLGYIIGRAVAGRTDYDTNFYFGAMTGFEGLSKRGVEVRFLSNKLKFIYKSSGIGTTNPFVEWLNEYCNDSTPDGVYIACIGLLSDDNKNPLRLNYDRMNAITMTTDWK